MEGLFLPLCHLCIASTRRLFAQFCYVKTRHRASTSTYSLTFNVRVTTPRSMDEMERHTQQACRCWRGQGESSPACLVRGTVHVVALADYCWALPRISSVAIATQPVHRLQIRPIVHIWGHPPPLPQVTSRSVQ